MCLWLNRVLQRIQLIAPFALATGNICLHTTSLAAAQVIDLSINDKQGVYQLALEMILDAPLKDVRYVITDYAHIYRIDPSIVESEIVDTPDRSTTRVRTRINDCVLTFCRDILRVEDVRQVDDDDIDSVVVPQLSNVKLGAAHWKFHSFGDKTRINYNLSLEPGFFVPPLVGSPIVEKKIREETLICFNNIERIARIRSERGKPPNATQNETLSKTTTSEHDKPN
jgi:hypothetical protein